MKPFCNKINYVHSFHGVHNFVLNQVKTKLSLNQFHDSALNLIKLSYEIDKAQYMSEEGVFLHYSIAEKFIFTVKLFFSEGCELCR